jgi:hypothetical protein
VIAVTRFRGTDELKRFAAEAIGTIGRGLPKLPLDLIIDFLLDISGRDIGSQHFLIVLDLYGTGRTGGQISEFHCGWGRRRRCGSDWLRLVAAAEQKRRYASAKKTKRKPTRRHGTPHKQTNRPLIKIVFCLRSRSTATIMALSDFTSSLRKDRLRRPMVREHHAESQI